MTVPPPAGAAGPASDSAAIIGRTRGRFRLHQPWYAWGILLGLPIAVAGLIALTGDLLAAAITFALIALLATVPLCLVLLSFRVHVTERAIVIGPFLPGFRRTVHLFSDIDASTIRSWRNLSAYLRASRTPALMTAGLIAPGARGGVSYRVQRAGRLTSGRLEENPLIRDLGGTCELFALAGGSARFVRVLARAMQEAGAASEQEILALALEPGRLSPEPGAHLTQIPGHPQPAQTRFEDLPPERQAQIRQHIVGR